jgi:hypothetical protein
VSTYLADFSPEYLKRYGKRIPEYLNRTKVTFVNRMCCRWVILVLSGRERSREPSDVGITSKTATKIAITVIEILGMRMQPHSYVERRIQVILARTAGRAQLKRKIDEWATAYER